MAVNYRWDNEEKTVLRLVASGQWTWQEFHRAAQISRVNMMNGGSRIDTIVDLRGGDRIPAGAVAHARTFGKPENPRQTGRTVVIGMDDETVRKISGEARTLRVSEGHMIYFVATEDEVRTLLEEWWAADEQGNQFQE